MLHPSEYELRPSDIEALSEAELIVFAGYEGMVARLKEVADGAKLLGIRTDHSLETLESSIMAIAELTGTVDQARRNLAELRTFVAEWRDQLLAMGADELSVAVHVFQRPLAKELGLPIAGVFGPAPLEATQIRALAEKRPGLIIDNVHNPVGAPLEEAVPEAPVVLFRNFPETSREGDILDVLKANQKILEEVLSR
jgi:hypothetical protein